MDHRIAKVIFLKKRDADTTKLIKDRESYMDKRLIIIDATGNCFNFIGWKWNETPAKLLEKCIDVVTDGD